MTFQINNLNSVLLLGASPNMGGYLSIIEKAGLRGLVATSPAQLAEVPDGIEARAFETLGKEFRSYVLKQVEPARTLFVSLGARWLFKNDIILDLMQGNLVNFHGSRLPFDAGGGGYSWRIMRRDRIDNQLVHLVDEGIDSGPVLMHQASLFPRSATTPADFESYHNEHALTFFADFIGQVANGEALTPKHQVDYIGNYFPRLMTARNGWIDWSWTSDQIESFVAAFDDPYAGASTIWNEQIVRVKKLQRHGGEFAGHPFTAGLVMRHDQDWIVVSSGDAFSFIIEEVLDANGANLIKEIKVGDRFYTPHERLLGARSERIRYGAS